MGSDLTTYKTDKEIKKERGERIEALGNIFELGLGNDVPCRTMCNKRLWKYLGRASKRVNNAEIAKSLIERAVDYGVYECTSCGREYSGKL